MSKPTEAPATPSSVTLPKVPTAHPLDELTGGAFSAPTSGERAAKVRAWLTTGPSTELMTEVFKELSHRDKGAARALKDKLDEIKRSKGQEAIAADWAAKAQALVSASKFNMADALAWQRDAAKAGAPLSKPPLSELRAELAERVKRVEDVQHRLLVQREAAMLLAQRCEGLSVKPLADALAAKDALAQDVTGWQSQSLELQGHPDFGHVDSRLAGQVLSAGTQLQAVWSAFAAASASAEAAMADPSAPLPAVPVWAEAVRAARGLKAESSAESLKTAVGPSVDPEERAQAIEAVQSAMVVVERELAEGHTKALHKAVADLRSVLKSHGRKIDTTTDHAVQAILARAGELEGWQRWRADQIREELVAKAEALAAPYREWAMAQRATKVVVKPAKPVKVSVKPSAKTPAAEMKTSADLSEQTTSSDEAEKEITLGLGALAQSSSAVVEPADSGLSIDTLMEVRPERSVGTDLQSELLSDAGESVPAFVNAGGSAASVEVVAATPMPKEGLGGRKMQAALRDLRDQWKQTDAGGAPNHGLWRRFDEACSVAHAVVAHWLDKVRSEEAGHRAQRLALISQLEAWGSTEAAQLDPKAQARALQQFAQAWREGGHVGEKTFEGLQAQWKAAMKAASAGLDRAQSGSIDRRKSLIEAATVLAASVPAHGLRIDAVKQLQSDWQREAQSVTLDRKLENRLWEQFRSQVDAAFAAKTQAREAIVQRMSLRDKKVLEAAKALEDANATGDAVAIRGAMDGLQAALRARDEQPAGLDHHQAAPVGESKLNETSVAEKSVSEATEKVAETAKVESVGSSGSAEAMSMAAKLVVARRGDDRPGAKSHATAQRGQVDGRGGRTGGPGDRRPDASGASRNDRGRGPGPTSGGREGGRGFGERRYEGDRERNGRSLGARDRSDASPRLGDVAFRAQRDALEAAQAQLRKLSALAHGEAVSGVLDAWEHRSAASLPAAQALGKGVSAALRSQWEKSLAQAAGASRSELLLRLEMAAEVPTPAAHLSERRAMQLQLLTQRHAEPPAKTWGDDVAVLLQGPFEADQAQRLRAALKALLR